ncbi:MAG: DUF4125 family protein [Dehalococcoidales bacterium]|nr:DUF4125 family protein [Dehalococcoidales bacterium]
MRNDNNIKKDIITKVVKAEWEMFTNVENAGGKAVCQEDYATFEINRTGQALSWSEAVLKSYLADLNRAKEQGRNLMTEKYARMMASTSPSEYEAIKDLLPQLGTDIPVLIDKIVPIVLEWEETLLQKYPHILKTGRPLHSSEDSPGVTSLETYFRGELATYSKETLNLYYENLLQQKAENINGSEVTLQYAVTQYGFNSLEEVNEKLKTK